MPTKISIELELWPGNVRRNSPGKVGSERLFLKCFERTKDCEKMEQKVKTKNTIRPAGFEPAT